MVVHCAGRVAVLTHKQTRGMMVPVTNNTGTVAPAPQNFHLIVDAVVAMHGHGTLYAQVFHCHPAFIAEGGHNQGATGSGCNAHARRNPLGQGLFAVVGRSASRQFRHV